MRLSGQISGERQHAMGRPVPRGRLRLVLLFAVLTACTPVAAVNRNEMSGKQGVSAEAGDGGVAASTVDSDEGPTRVTTARIADACYEPGNRSCSTADLRVPLLCEDLQWQAQGACGASERCETEQGALVGTCVPVATQCLSHPAGEEFCDGDLIRYCEDLVPSKGRKCEARRRCMEVGGSAQCVCALGWVDDGSGAGCQEPTSCAKENGGCDLLTECTLTAGVRVCSACPPGYAGDGESGCYGQLTALTAAPGLLTPVFSPEIHSYRVVLPLLQQSVLVNASAAENVRVTFNDVEQPTPASGWQSPPLPLGEHKVEITLTTRIGLESKYELLIERTGVQEAYLKAAHPDGDDEFGSSVAIWGDTIAIGVAQEDSDGARDHVNNSIEGSGAVYVFVRNGDTWTQQDYLKADPPRSGDYFGTSVALHGDTLVVGAPGATALVASTPHGGSAHVFTRQAGKWSLHTKLELPDTGVQDLFGTSVVLDDKRVIVGTPFEGSGATFSGAIYVFERSGEGYGAARRIKAMPTRASGLFGWSLVLEGDTLVVGSPQYNPVSPSNTGPGLAYVFTASNADWIQQQELMPPASLEDGATFGWAVDIEGNTIAVGAPRARSANLGQSPGDAFVYTRASGGAWGMAQPFRAPVPRASDWYGYVVKLSAASTLLIASVGDASGAAGLLGTPNNDAALDSGAIFMYGLHNNEWLSTTYIKASNPDNPDYFGSAIAVYGDTFVATSPGEASDAPGNQASNAAPSAGAAYVFR